MPALGNLTSKKWDGTTTVTLTAIQPSGGDSPAIWRDNAVGDNAQVRPTLTYSFRKNAKGDATRFYVKFVGPQSYIDAVTSLRKVANTAIFELSGVVPLGMSEQAVKDYFAVMAHALLPANGTLAEAIATGTGVI